eukprot:3122109-Rhodomonas_salina.3
MQHSINTGVSRPESGSARPYIGEMAALDLGGREEGVEQDGPVLKVRLRDDRFDCVRAPTQRRAPIQVDLALPRFLIECSHALDKSKQTGGGWTCLGRAHKLQDPCRPSVTCKLGTLKAAPASSREPNQHKIIVATRAVEQQRGESPGMSQRVRSRLARAVSEYCVTSCSTDRMSVSTTCRTARQPSATAADSRHGRRIG